MQSGNGSSSGQHGQPPIPVVHLASLASIGPLKPAPSPGPLGPEGVPIPAGAMLAAPAAGGRLKLNDAEIEEVFINAGDILTLGKGTIEFLVWHRCRRVIIAAVPLGKDGLEACVGSDRGGSCRRHFDRPFFVCHSRASSCWWHFGIMRCG